MTDTTNTRTRERVKSAVETVQHTEYQCSNCRQWYGSEAAIVPVALNAKADTPADADEVGALCENCAEVIFDYKGSTDASVSDLRDAVIPYYDESAVKSLQSKLVSTLGVLLVGAVTIGVGMHVLDTTIQAVFTGEVPLATGQPEDGATAKVFLLVTAGVMVVGMIDQALKIMGSQR